MAEEKASRQGEGLSLQTLIVAAVASGVAAVVVSHLWHEGTVLAAAMTPVFVAILKEALQRPIESDVVRRSASRVSEVATARRAVSGLAAGRAEAGRRSTPATGTVPPPPPPPSRNGDTTGGDVIHSGPRRTYATTGNGRRTGFARVRGRPLKLAVVTGLLAFLVAAVVLTVPELIFGGSVSSSGGHTTIFGGAKSKSKDENGKSSGDKGNQSNDQQQQDQGGSSQPQGGSTQTQPSQPSQTQTQPQQTQPSQPPPSGGGGGGTSPTPRAPSPSAPQP